MKIILFAAYLFCCVLGVILMKYGGMRIDISSISIIGIKINIYTLIGILLYGLGFIIWIYLVQKFDLTKLLPFVMAIYNAMTILLSVILLGEKISLMNCVGIGIIITGVVVTNL